MQIRSKYRHEGRVVPGDDHSIVEHDQGLYHADAPLRVQPALVPVMDLYSPHKPLPAYTEPRPLEISERPAYRQNSQHEEGFNIAAPPSRGDGGRGSYQADLAGSD
jgi:hypothetical protein